MRKWLLILSFISLKVSAQELYVFSEPASNMPSRSLSVKQTAKFLRTDRSMGRHTTELMLGMNKDLMLHLAGTLSNMFSQNTRFESMRVYGKYRFLSTDELYRHFRMAVFAEGAYSRNDRLFDEMSLDGDQSGFQAGIIATQLLHKLAISSTLSWTEIVQHPDEISVLPKPRRAFGYSLSTGYLVLPKAYTDYNQTNLNVYVELLGQNALDMKKYYVDLAPAMQLIFSSQAKLNIGYRFQLGSDMTRMSKTSWLISFEWLFLNVLK